MKKDFDITQFSDEQKEVYDYLYQNKSYELNTLIDLLIGKSGLPLPQYDYDVKMFTVKQLKNIPNGLGGVTCVQRIHGHDTFEDGCVFLLKTFLTY